MAVPAAQFKSETPSPNCQVIHQPGYNRFRPCFPGGVVQRHPLRSGSNEIHGLGLSAYLRNNAFPPVSDHFGKQRCTTSCAGTTTRRGGAKGSLTKPFLVRPSAEASRKTGLNFGCLPPIRRNSLSIMKKPFLTTNRLTESVKFACLPTRPGFHNHHLTEQMNKQQIWAGQPAPIPLSLSNSLPSNARISVTVVFLLGFFSATAPRWLVQSFILNISWSITHEPTLSSPAHPQARPKHFFQCLHAVTPVRPIFGDSTRFRQVYGATFTSLPR